MLFRKFLRDVWHNKIQFFSILIMAALSSYIYAGMGSLYNGLEYELDDYYSKANYADSIIYSASGISNNDIDKIENIKGVDSVESRFVYNEAIDFNNNNASIILNVVDADYKISKCIVKSGSNVTNDPEGIWLDERFAIANNIKVGDNFGLNIEGYDIEKVVKGLVINPEYIYQVNVDNIVPNHKDMGFAFITYEGVESLGIKTPNEVIVRMKKGWELNEDLLAKSYKNYDIIQTRDDIAGHTMFNQAIDQYRAIGIIFPIAFLAVTILTMLTTITRLVDKQRVEIGTLGTLGLKKNKIYRHYISFGFFPALLGCMIGVICAPFSLPYTFYGTLKSLYTMPKWNPRLPYNSFIIVLLCISLCVLVTYNTIRKVLNETPAQAIKPKVSKEIDNSKLLQSDVVNNMNFSTKWNLIDLIKGKTRMFMTVVGIAGCIGLLIAGFGFKDSLNEVVKSQYDRLYLFNTKIALDKDKIINDVGEDIAENLTDKYDGVEFIYEGQVDIRKGNKRKLTNIIVGTDIELIKYYSSDRKQLSLAKDSINISRKLANYLHIDTGDRIKIKMFGTKEYKEVTIGNIYVAPITQGIVIDKELYEELGYSYYSNYALSTSKKVSAGEEGVIKVITKDKLRKDYQITKETLDSISLILMASAVVLAIVVLYNLNMLSLYEKQNEFALLKVLGFKSSRIRNLLLKQTLFLVVIGVLVGIPFGLGLLFLILNTMGDSVDMTMKVSFISFLISIVITCGLSIGLNLLFIINIKKIDMVSSLKNIE